jgi:hypothetical protein
VGTSGPTPSQPAPFQRAAYTSVLVPTKKVAGGDGTLLPVV